MISEKPEYKPNTRFRINPLQNEGFYSELEVNCCGIANDDLHRVLIIITPILLRIRVCLNIFSVKGVMFLSAH